MGAGGDEMKFEEVKDFMTRDWKRIRSGAWPSHVSIGIQKDATNSFCYVYHDETPMGLWHPSKRDIDAIDWEVAL